MKFVSLVPLVLVLMLSKAGDSIEDYCLEEQKFKETLGEALYNHIASDKNDDKDKSYRKISLKSDKVYKVITYGSPETKEALIKIVDQKDSELVLTEIKRLILLKDLKVTPNYEGCLKLNDKYIIIHEKVHDDLFSEKMIGMFKGLNRVKKTFKFIQIAMAIQTLHSKKLTHQSIRPYNIVSVDPEMTDLRILDLSYSKEIGDSVNLGKSDYDIRSELYRVDMYKANFRQDAYACAITMINLLNGDESLFTNVKFKTLTNFTTYKNSMTHYFDQSLSKTSFTELTGFFRSTLLLNHTKVNINLMIEKLFDIYTGLQKTNLKENLDEKVKEFKVKFQSNSKAINSILSSPRKVI